MLINYIISPIQLNKSEINKPNKQQINKSYFYYLKNLVPKTFGEGLISTSRHLWVSYSRSSVSIL